MRLKNLFVLVLVGIFLAGLASAWTDNGMATQNVDGCGTLSTANASYTLTQNLADVVGNCFVISANNITFNGAGNMISGAEMSDIEGWGFFLDGFNNFYLHDITITQMGDFIPVNYLAGGGIDMFGANFSVFRNINLQFSHRGVRMTSSNNNSFYNLTISNNIGAGLWLLNSFNNSFFNIISWYNFGIWDYGSVFLDVSSNNNFYNVVVLGAQTAGLALRYSNNNYFYNLSSFENYEEGIDFFSSLNNSFRNVDCYGNSVLPLRNNIDSDNWATSTGNFLIFNNSYGEVKFSSLIVDLDDGDDIRFASGLDIIISLNSAYVTSSISGLNRSANITFYNLNTDRDSATILRNGVACGSACYNFTPLNAGNVTFNVTSWSNYSIDFSPLVTIFNISNGTDTTPTFTYNVTDDSTVKNCSLYVTSSYKGSNATAINPSANNTITSTALVVGNYNAYISCEDNLGNIGNSSTISFAVSSTATEEDSGSSGSGGTVSYSVSQDNLEKGYKRIMKARDYFKFNISNETHSLTLDKINKSFVDVTVRSSPQNFRINLGDYVLVDANSDGVYDLNVSYTKYLSYYAEINLKKVSVFSSDKEYFDGR